MSRQVKRAALPRVPDDPRREPAKWPPGVAGVRSLLLLLQDLPLEGGDIIPRGWIVAARHVIADPLLDSGHARSATEPDLAAFGRDPVEI